MVPKTGHVLQDDALVFKIRLFSGLETGRFDLLTLEVPYVQHAKFLLLRAIHLLQAFGHFLPVRKQPADLIHYFARSREIIEHPELHVSRKQKLLIVLTMNVAQEGRQLT